jgi:hypothetical protein
MDKILGLFSGVKFQIFQLVLPLIVDFINKRIKSKEFAEQLHGAVPEALKKNMTIDEIHDFIEQLFATYQSGKALFTKAELAISTIEAKAEVA